tara:strand:- start:2520 stop:3680 length:1161 start_codon:yes stop_codon:yes gene_type:complete
MIPYGKQDISEVDIEAVQQVLKSDFLTQGPVLPAFEQSVATYCQAKHAVAVNSATSALHIACLALGVTQGDMVWTSPITFVASANCALYCGAEVDFVDIDPRTYNLCPIKLEGKLKIAQQQNQLPKVVIAVHLSGQPCDMEAIAQLSKIYGFSVIEDASHAIGARYQDEAVGHCTYSDITVFSFHPVKIITTAEGGIATTNSDVLLQKMQLYRSHGVTRDIDLMEGTSHGAWYYQQIDLGFNYRMTELQAALGLSQMSRLDAFVAKRNQLAANYDEALAQSPLILPYQAPECMSSRHLYIIQIQPESGVSRKKVFDDLRAQGIGVNLHYIPVHTQPYYQSMGFNVGQFPEAEHYYAHALSLPLHPNLTLEEQQTVIHALSKSLGCL